MQQVEADPQTRRPAELQTCRPAARRQLSLKTETLSLDRVLERLRSSRRPSAIKRKFNFEFINSKEKYEHATHNTQHTAVAPTAPTAAAAAAKVSLDRSF